MREREFSELLFRVLLYLAVHSGGVRLERVLRDFEHTMNITTESGRVFTTSFLTGDVYEDE